MLELTTKYAIKLLIYLSKNNSDEYLKVTDISEELKIPGAYLSKVVKILAEAKLLKSRRGAYGGIKKVENKKITLFEICSALEDPIVIQECFLSKSKCSTTHPCPMHNHWKELRNRLSKFLEEKSI